MSHGLFVTGTDTEVGKTFASCVMIAALRARGLRVAPFKPIAAGATPMGETYVNEDTLALMSAAGLDRAPPQSVTPVLLQAAMAPHIAAAREGVAIDLGVIQRAYLQARAGADFVLVEGVGGFRVPLDDAHDTVDLARALALPIVIVVGMRLGCLNHALLTAQAVEAAGLRLAGWIANELSPGMAALEENIAALDARLGAPRLGRLPWSPSTPLQDLASKIDVAALLAASA